MCDDESLLAFLREHELVEVADKLAGESLASMTKSFFDEGRTLFLKSLQERGIGLKVRQALANKLNAASRTGVAGIAESEEEIRSRTAWLDVSGASSAEDAWPPSRRRYLVFTSAGDANKVHHWVEESDAELGNLERCTARLGIPRVGGRDDFDLCVVYYGSAAEDPPCMQVADRSLRMQGGKFPNLVAAMKLQRDYFAGFEAILVADDDLEGLGAHAIACLFQARRALDVWYLQPANHPEIGKADIDGTRAEKGVSHRFVNFCEVTAPLLRTDKLIEFLHAYIPRRHEGDLLVGYGIDCWLSQVLLGTDAAGESAHRDKAAVIDCIPFINPTNEAKPRGREIDRLQPWDKRLELWQAVAKRRGMVEWFKFITFERVHLAE